MKTILLFLLLAVNCYGQGKLVYNTDLKRGNTNQWIYIDAPKEKKILFVADSVDYTGIVTWDSSFVTVNPKALKPKHRFRKDTTGTTFGRGWIQIYPSKQNETP